MNTIKTGPHIIRENTTFKKLNNKTHDNYGKIPYGIVPFILNLLFFITLLLCGILIPNEKIKWNDAFLIASISSFCMNILWIIFRQNFLEEIRYYFFSFWKKSFGYKLTKNINYSSIDIKRNIDDIDEYKNYLKKRKWKTKILFWLSFSIHLLLLILSSIFIFIF